MTHGPSDSRLANYRLDRLLGSGGMGAVYLAHDLTLDRDVAVKFITAARALDATARQRLLREAKAAAALDHPNICSIYDVITDSGGQAAIVMQYVKGDSVADLLRRGSMEPAVACSMAADVARALAAAHARSVIHRDVKPANIIVTPDGQAKLLDFGVAHVDDASATAQDASTVTALTAEHLILGTPAYMSPEQAQRRAIDGRSDLFSLGVVLYECLTGSRPFTGRSPVEILAAILHQHPPSPSTLRPGLTAQHDEICRRLLAKDPGDRFASADEVLGALRMLSSGSSSPRPRPTSRIPAWLAVAALLVALAAAGVGRWGLPAHRPNADASRWYQRGVEALRDGSYHSARQALTAAIRADPAFTAAYIRLAEAEAELDEAEAAQRALLEVTQRAAAEWLLPRDQRTRVRAVRALMLRDVDAAVGYYQAVASSARDEAGAWLDLGRAQEAAAFNSDARNSYDTAVRIDSQYAAAHLRRAALLGLEGQRTEALAAFSEAERLFREQGPNIEGEVETLIRRGTFLNAVSDFAGARSALERAADLAGKLENHAQQIRAQLQLSSVTASEGKWEEAQRMAVAAVASAMGEHLETIAADGLVDLATVLILKKKVDEADAHLQRAIELAENRGALRIAARARLQRASAMLESGRAREAIAAAQAPLEYFHEKRYRRFELTALAIVTRAYEALDRYAEASTMGQQALKTAVEIKDEAQEAVALENLAGQANMLGSLPAALAHRVRGTQIHRKLNDLTALPFDLVNQADLLIRLGRLAEGKKLLDEVDAGIAKGLDAYLPRGRRVRMLRAFSAAIRGEADAVRQLAERFPLAPEGTRDTNARLAAALLRYINLGAPPEPNETVDAALTPGNREVRYWELLARLRGGDAIGTHAAVAKTFELPGATLSDEFVWRIAAIGAAAARQMNDRDRERTLAQRADASLARLRKAWGRDAATYEARPDLVELRGKAGLRPAH